MSNAKIEITSLNQTIQEQTDNIQSLQIDIENKNQTISTLNTKNKEQETTIAKLQKDNYNLLKTKKELSDINNQLKNKLPLKLIMLISPFYYHTILSLNMHLLIM